MTGDELRQWRERLGLKVHEAASRLGVSPDTYSRMERRDEIDQRTALACAAIAFGLPPYGAKA